MLENSIPLPFAGVKMNERKIMIMKKMCKRLVCLFLVLTMVFVTNATAFAAEKVSYKKSIEKKDEVQIAKETYANLSPEAKVIFDGELAKDKELLEFHKTHVDPSYEKTSNSSRTIYGKVATYSVTRAVTTDPMTILSAKLAVLSLPSAVAYSLKAMGAGMVAAIADGPLPIGDILLAAAAVSAAIVIAVNWNEVCENWNSIVSAFRAAFAVSSSNVKSAFVTILSDVNAELAINPAITVDKKRKTVKVNGVTYLCNTRAAYLTKEDQKNIKYMLAYRTETEVWVATVELKDYQAKLIASFNRSDIGVWATSRSYASALCKNGRPCTTGIGEGYYPHFHHIQYTAFHCWYLG